MRFVKGEPAEAEKCLREAMSLHEAHGNISGRNTAARRLVFWLATSRRMPEAVALAEEVLALAQRHEGPDRVAGTLLDYSMAVTAVSDWARSVELATGALEGFRAVGNQHDAIRALSHLAGCLRMLGDFDRAEAMQLQSLRMLDEVDVPNLKVAALANLAGLYKRSGRLKQAEECYLQVIESQRKVGDVRMLGHNGGNYAELLHMQGRLAEAEQAYREALKHLESGVDQHVQAVHRGRYAVLLADMGRMDEAAPLYRQCIEALQAHGDNNELKKAREAMASVCAKHGLPVPG
jgi:tetratricopeptide (TPR) repeat protein